jgi:hypothetical protein
VANAVAALIDAPVTIEDRSSRVLAFSGRQDEADQSRAETILGRQVPERYSQLLTGLGVFRELYRSASCSTRKACESAPCRSTCARARWNSCEGGRPTVTGRRRTEAVIPLRQPVLNPC